jgi:hypothetical protein
MKTRLFVYTGTGNSLWVVRRLALELKEATLEFMPHLAGDLGETMDNPLFCSGSFLAGMCPVPSIAG